MTRSPETRISLMSNFMSGDRLGKATDDFDGGLTAPALARQIPPAGLVIRGEDLLLQRPHIALDRLVEQYVPGRYADAARASPHRGLRVLLRSEEHTSELQSRSDLVCRLL